MIQDGVEPTNIGGAMVKAINRKPRAFQTPGEKSYLLDAHETRLRERLQLVNHVEDTRLARLQRQIASSERANVGRILRRKDQMRVTLINIASSKRKIRANVGDFERRLKNGTNSPVFALEQERIRRKEQELEVLCERLRAPNSQLLAAHVQDELRSIESRLDASPSRLVSSQPPSVAETCTPIKPETSTDQKILVNDTTSQPVEQTKTMPINNIDHHLDEMHAKMSKAIISRPKNSDLLHDHEEGHFPITLSTDFEPKTIPREASRRTPVPKPGTPAELKDASKIQNNVVPVEVPVRELPPLRVTRSNKQRYLALMQQKLVRTANRDREISNSALQRERHAVKRVAELKVKTREDIQGRRTADSDDSLGSIKQQEAVTRLQVTRMGSILPGVMEAPERSREKARDHATPAARATGRRRRQSRRATDSATTGVSLPPLRINVEVLKELKESRLRHRHQSHKLPKLP
ncbi:uncharacterized protein LOC110986579 [Acanthaster planci]|uniref:Uncharacterized protein LOC110986579 n=1 Tax=Acanthaster planci TaxID=133434 RepID=A0A8B7ZF37_ACAPL|nr:uncharacterized protein LOC110986579 [Acanthaster planci]XP_022104241.1 uncharacterized protein LOC110986579 [Acanthaster planci]XP_022104242.1 uncharacterized protein LOC110986579 [Acanthaster planci]XP_022104243.1 uncharacterized protein LOC110986579 [Acanthaster planci]XP_022104244.1 uncharacterized protein LOC110986579 [Acanthaster planci]